HAGSAGVALELPDEIFLEGLDRVVHVLGVIASGYGANSASRLPSDIPRHNPGNPWLRSRGFLPESCGKVLDPAPGDREQDASPVFGALGEVGIPRGDG